MAESTLNCGANPPTKTSGQRQTTVRTWLALTLAIGTVLLVGWNLRSIGLRGADKPTAPKEGPKPKVYSLLHITLHQPAILGTPRPNDFMSGGDLDTFHRNQAMLVKSRLVLNAALNQPEVANLKTIKQQEEPAEWLEDNVLVDFPNNANILRIGMDCGDLEEMRVLVKAVTTAYLQEVVNRDRNQTFERLNNLKDVVARYDQVVQAKKNQIKQIVGRGIHKQPNLQVEALKKQLLPQELAECKRELRRVKLEKVTAQVRLTRLRADKKAQEAAPLALAKLEEEVAILTEQEKLLTEEEKQLLEQAGQAQSQAFDLSELQEDIDYAKAIMKEAQQQAERLKVELSAPPRVQLLEDTINRRK